MVIVRGGGGGGGGGVGEGRAACVRAALYSATRALNRP